MEVEDNVYDNQIHMYILLGMEKNALWFGFPASNLQPLDFNRRIEEIGTGSGNGDVHLKNIF